MSTTLKAVRCPCCGNEYDNLDSTAEYNRVVKWTAKHLSPAQREARRVQLAINRQKHQNKTV